MITKIIDKGTAYVSKEKATENLFEITKKRLMVFSLIKEAAVLEKEKEEKEVMMTMEQDQVLLLNKGGENDSIIPILCETYVVLVKLGQQLSNLLIEYEDKAQIKFEAVNREMYIIFYQALKNFEVELKYVYNLCLCKNDELN